MVSDRWTDGTEGSDLLWVKFATLAWIDWFNMRPAARADRLRAASGIVTMSWPQWPDSTNSPSGMPPIQPTGPANDSIL